jgi:type II secretion system (T2SS) protein E
MRQPATTEWITVSGSFVSGNDLFLPERPRLGDLLTKKGLITPSQLESALAEARSSGELLGRALVRRGYVFEDELARTLAEQMSLLYVDVTVLGIDPLVARMLPAAEGRRAAAIPVAVVRGQIRVVFADPSDETAQSIVARYIPPGFEVVVGELSAIESAWNRIDRGRG